MFVLEEAVVLILLVFGLCLILAGFAWAIRKVLVWIGSKNGYSADQLPMHYHIFGIGTYFSVLFIIWLASVMT